MQLDTPTVAGAGGWPGAPQTHGVVVTPAARVVRLPVEWLWPGRVPYSGVTLLVGDPGCGKSLLTMGLAADVSRGRLGGVPAPVLVANAEDAYAEVMRPRLEAAGADLDLVAFVHYRSAEGYDQPLELPVNVQELAAQVAALGARLVVIDPLMAHLPEQVNSWRDHSVRRALAPLSRLAAAHGCAVVVVAHLNKAPGSDPLRRIGGSVGIQGAARSALLLARDPDDPDGEHGRLRVLAHVKSNYAEQAPSLRYEVEPVVIPAMGVEPEVATARLRLVGECAHTGRDLLAQPEAAPVSKLGEAEEFLRAALGAGPRPKRDVEEDAKAVGITPKTLRNAREALGVVTEREHAFQAGTYWALPPSEEAAARRAHVPGAPLVPNQEGHDCTTPLGKRESGVFEPATEATRAHASVMGASGADEAPVQPGLTAAAVSSERQRARVANADALAAEGAYCTSPQRHGYVLGVPCPACAKWAIYDRARRRP